VYIKQDGSGDRVFFGLHGWGGDHTTFAPLLEFLPDDATFYSLELPGCGRSPAPPDLSLATVSREIADAIEQTGAQPVTIVGNCSGAIFGLVAMDLIAERINRLVLIDPFAYAPWYFRLFASPTIGRYAYQSTFANPIGRWITNLSLKRRRSEDVNLTETFGHVDHQVAFRYLQLLLEIDSVETFAWIRSPIDIIHGGRSFRAIREGIALWRGVWPQVRVHELEGAGHLPLQETPAALSRIIFHQ
jgi:pimeloyl-ACP methyl ester carboxylesterase